MPRALLLLLLLASPLLYAQQDDAAPPQAVAPKVVPHGPAPEAPTGTVHGTVLCTDTRRPARGALVMLNALPGKDATEQRQGPSSSMARTSMDGTYTLEHVAPGDYAVIGFLPGYLSPFDGLVITDPAAVEKTMLEKLGAGGIVSVRNHQSASHDITLQRGASVSGRVLYSDGAPASQVTIDLENVIAPSAPKAGEQNINVGNVVRTMFTHQTNGTDDQGNFRISGVAPGTYRLAAIQPASGGADLEGGDGMAFVMGMVPDPKALHFYSGDTLHRKSARTYELRPGDDVTGIDIVLPLNAFHIIHGSLTAKDGRPINAAGLKLTDTADDSFTFTTALDRDGTYAFPTVPSGTYTLAITNPTIGKVADGMDGVPVRFQTLIPTNAFADTTTTLIVKDADLLDATLTLAEIPLPAVKLPNPAHGLPPQE